jgi:hypothetical protein
MSKRISFCKLCSERHALEGSKHCWWCYQSLLSQLDRASEKEPEKESES